MYLVLPVFSFALAPLYRGAWRRCAKSRVLAPCHATCLGCHVTGNVTWHGPLLSCHMTTQVRSRDKPLMYPIFKCSCFSLLIVLLVCLRMRCKTQTQTAQIPLKNGLQKHLLQWTSWQIRLRVKGWTGSSRSTEMVRFRKLRRLQQSKQLKNSEYNRLKSNLSQEAKRRAIQEEWEMKQAKIEQLKSELAAVKAQPSAHLSIILPNAAPSNIPLTFFCLSHQGFMHLANGSME